MSPITTQPAMLKINIITLFPDLFEPFKNVLPLNRAIQENLFVLNIINLRDYAIDKRGTVDDRPYGGGTGMILRVEPIVNALNTLQKSHTILLSPRGTKFNQQKAKEFAKLNEFTIICGRYEGVDARIEEFYTDETISIGDFVLSGGETAAIAIVEATVRLLEGIFDKEGVTENDSHSRYYFEHPQYTRPEEFEGHKVPNVLLSGDHAEIEKWKATNSSS